MLDLHVMGRGVMLTVVVSQVPFSWAPIDVELALAGAVLEPIEIHIYWLCSFLFHCTVCKDPCGSVVYLDGGG